MWGTHAREFFSLSAYSAQSTEDHTDTQSTHLTSSASSSLNQHRARNPRAHTRQTTAVAHKQQIHKTNQHVCGTRGAGGLDLRARCCMSVDRWRSRTTVRGTVAFRWPVGRRRRGPSVSCTRAAGSSRRCCGTRRSWPEATRQCGTQAWLQLQCATK